MILFINHIIPQMYSSSITKVIQRFNILYGHRLLHCVIYVELPLKLYYDTCKDYIVKR
jgi:hypothetical protein